MKTNHVPRSRFVVVDLDFDSCKTPPLEGLDFDGCRIDVAEATIKQTCCFLKEKRN